MNLYIFFKDVIVEPNFIITYVEHLVFLFLQNTKKVITFKKIENFSADLQYKFYQNISYYQSPEMSLKS